MYLPTDSDKRKEYPLYSGLLRYFPAALAGVARHSFLGNKKHNPGTKELRHSRDKSSDHADCILRHLTDYMALLEGYNTAVALWREGVDTEYLSMLDGRLQDEVNALAWRALALSQITHELLGADVAPAAATSPEERL